jgi:hypothetical protein
LQPQAEVGPTQHSSVTPVKPEARFERAPFLRDRRFERVAFSC